jgi:hypothetical protein
MSFQAILKVGGKEIELLTCNYSFGQTTNERGMPSSDVFAGGISMTFEATDDDTSLLEWMVDPRKVLDGSIVFKRINDESTFKEVKFEKAYCISFSESFTSSGGAHSTISISITAKKITVGNVTHDSRWPVSV